MFNSADGTDPVTGEDAIELPIDAVSVKSRCEAPRSHPSSVCQPVR